MPATIVCEENTICRVKDDGNIRDIVSNFSITVNASVHVASDAGGPGLLLSLKRYPDNAERTIFCPMSEVSGTVKHFLVSVNQQFPGGALFLLLSDHEFRKLMMELTNSMMEGNQERALHAARLIGKNVLEETAVWVMSDTVQLTENGVLVSGNESPFLWLRRLVNGINILLQESLACKITTPLDDGEGITQLCLTIRNFMPENFMAAMATCGACIMGASYTAILSTFGCCGVPMLTGPPGSCKSEATKCALALYGAHETHSFNNQTTPSYLFKASSHTTIPICVDDVTERAADSWEELIIDAYNGTGRGTRLYGVEVFHTLPILSANWKVGMDRPRAHSRVIQIPFLQHEDEPEANLLFAAMSSSRDKVSKSLAKLVEVNLEFERPGTKEHINQHICPSVTKILNQFGAPARFTTTMSVFMYFFIELSKLAGMACQTTPIFTEEECWTFFAENMAPATSTSGCAERAEDYAAMDDSEGLVKKFLRALGEKVQDLGVNKVLKILAIDVTTACHLGTCIAIRMTEAVPLVNELQPTETFQLSSLQLALKLSGLGKQSKQRFLKSASNDIYVVKARKGSGGNTIPYKCFIVKQSEVDEETLGLLRKGLEGQNENVPLAVESGREDEDTVPLAVQGAQMDIPSMSSHSPSPTFSPILLASQGDGAMLPLRSSQIHGEASCCQKRPRLEDN